MLYLIYGNDREKGRARLHALREKLAAQGGSIEPVEEGTITGEMLERMSATRALFGGAIIFVFDSVLEKKAEQELVACFAGSFARSSNHMIIFEPALGKESRERLAEHAQESCDCSAKDTPDRPSFNIFSLGDALGARKKKDLWILYQEARAHGIEPEEISGTLFWTVKNMALVKKARGGDDVGLNPFVEKKTRGFIKNYTDEELGNLSHRLVTLYHEAHRGGEPMGIALEKFILTL